MKPARAAVTKISKFLSSVCITDGVIRWFKANTQMNRVAPCTLLATDDTTIILRPFVQDYRVSRYRTIRNIHPLTPNLINQLPLSTTIHTP